jgi:hypothetical protein
MIHRTASTALAGLLLATASLSAEAQGYRYGPSRGDYVVAESHFGKGTVSGPVRPGRHGLEVRLPGGTWIDCGRSCSDTLRRQSVDFWENQGGSQAKDAGRGYFNWRFGY